MVRSVDVPATVAADVLNQALTVLPPPLETSANTLRLGDAFEVWTLPNFTQSGNDIVVAAVQTGSLHHQLMAGTAAVGFVRSRQVGGGPSREVTQVAKSRLGERIQESIDLAGPIVSSIDPARLVIASAYRLFAFWFTDVTQLFIISAPATNAEVVPNALLLSTDFMTRLHHEQPVGGATKV